jgi:aminocarboxymuconate-semialdehyde decarboxylase
MILSGVFTKLPNLQVLLAHSGGTLPFLAGRIQSCIQHDGHFSGPGKSIDVLEILKKNIWLDAVIYDKVGLASTIEGASVDRVLFGE